MRAPFPWFGGKRRVAPQVWDALGDVDNYVEPFAGSLAVLLERPARFDRWETGAEIVNDKDQFISNFWRALTSDPEQVAHHANWPVNEADLLSRHLWLVNTGRERLTAMDNDPDWFDAKVAGWWVWGLCAWIGSGWCSGTGAHHLGTGGQGVNRQLPHLGRGQGVNRQLPHIGDAGQGVTAYMVALAGRLRRTRVCCGDWSRVVTNGALAQGATVGVFLDPPYLGDIRRSDLYAVDDHTISHEVREWCLTNGDNPRLRIVLAGYLPEHDHLIPDTWRRVRYSANAAYSTTNSAKRQDGNHKNRHLECLWMSPACPTATTDTQGVLL